MQDHVLHSLTIAQVMVNYALERGVATSAILKGTGIDDAQLGDPEALITPDQELVLISNLQAAFADTPALGFEVGLQYALSTFGVWGFTLSISENMAQGFERAVRFLALSTAYCAVGVDRGAREFRITFNPEHIPQAQQRFLLERDMGTGLRLSREFNKNSQPVREIQFEGPPPPYQDRLQQLAGVPVIFGQIDNALVVDAQTAMEPNGLYDEKLVRLMEDQCQSLMDRRQIGGLSGQIRGKLLGGLGLSASLDEVAAEIGMTARTLRRKLEEDGTSFREISDLARRQLAEQMLLSTAMKIDELAFHLGYSDTASFTRAFRRWHGISPGAYRAAQSN